VNRIWDELGAYAPIFVAGLLVLFPPLWSLNRHLVTLVHEAGHAIVALLTGRKLVGIRLHTDTSGLTVSRGKPRGPGMIATTAAGYLAPPLVGVLAAILLTGGQLAVLGWATLAVVAAMLLYIRNLFGAAMLILAGVILVYLDRHSPVELRQHLFLIGAWVLVLGNFRTLVEVSRNRSGRTDIDQLRWLTHMPRIFWILGMFGVTAFCGLAVWEMQGL
jgi:hypothetical protein